MWNKIKTIGTSILNFFNFGQPRYEATSLTDFFNNWGLNQLFFNVEEQQFNQQILVSRSRDLYRNNPIAKMLIDRIVDLTIANGIKILFKVYNKEETVEKKINNIWKRFIERLDFYNIQRQVLTTLLRDGEIIINSYIYKNELHLEFIESEYIDFQTDKEKNIYNGILVNPRTKKPIGAIIRNPFDLNKSKILKFYENNIQWAFFLRLNDRVNQLRGVPLMTPLMKEIKGFDKYLEGEINTAIISSFLNVFIKTNRFGALPMNPISDTSTNLNNNLNKNIQLGIAQIHFIDDGTDIITLDPKKPSTEFNNFTDTLIKLLSSALSVPPEILVLSFNSNYSASRMAVLMLDQTLFRYKHLLEYHFIRPFIKLFLTIHNISLKHIKNINIIWDKLPHIDPTKNLTEIEKKIQLGLITREEILEQEGKNFNIIAEKLKKENEIMNQINNNLNFKENKNAIS